MLVGSTIYSLFILSLLSKNILLVYFASSLLGIAAALLWTGQNSYLIRVSNQKSYGTALGFLIAKFHYEIPLLWYSFLPLAGFLFLTGLTDLKVKQQTSQFKLAAKFLTNIIPLRLSIFYFAFSFINGLVFGIIPIDI